MIIDELIFAPGLGSKVIVNPTIDSVVAGVTFTDVSSFELGDIMPISVSNDTAGVSQLLQIGDPDLVIDSIFGLSKGTATSWDIGNYTAIQLASFFRKGAIIREFNLESTNAAQFASSFIYYAVDVDGSAAKKDIKGSLASSTRATYNQTTIRTLDFGVDSGVLMNHQNAMYLTQIANTTLNLTITLQAILR
tara:strand:- start:6065 stop:6640 length:576 start_codon:yes stop_codon:yes gene_type:complete